MTAPPATDGAFALNEEQKAKVLKQVEFYFSDSNLPRDAFMLEQVRAHPEGFVPLALLATFSRMASVLKVERKKGVSAPPEIVAAVADAVAESTLLELSKDRTAVKRANPLPESEELAKQVDEQSLYASPFPFDATLDDLTEFFGKVGELKSVRMRRHLASKDFRGSVFVEFGSAEEAERIAKESLTYAGAALTLEPKAEYVKRREVERAAKAAAQAEAPPAVGDKRSREEENEAAAEPATKIAAVELPTYTPGCCVAFDFGEDTEFNEAPTFHLIKDTFGGRDAGLQYADYQAGAKSGVVRFSEPAQAQQAVTGVDAEGGMMVAGYHAAVKVLEGDEEKEYMIKVAAARAEHKQDDRRPGGRGSSGRGRGRGRGRGGRGGRRGGRR